MELTYTVSGSQVTRLQATGNNASSVSLKQEDIRPQIRWQCRSELTVDRMASEDSLSSDAWICLLRDALFSIQGIESMHLARDETTIDVWTVIPKRDIGLVRKIAEIQRDLMSQFINHQREPLFYFDFHTVYRESNALHELIPLRAIRIPRS